jgi:hypothetical protein
VKHALRTRASRVRMAIMAGVTLIQVSAVVVLAGYHVNISHGTDWIVLGMGGALGVSVPVLAWTSVNLRAGALRHRFAARSTKALTGLACALAGPRHAHLRDAWSADLYGDPQGGLLTAGHRLRLAAGFVVAAIRCRLDDATELAWRKADRLLGSRRDSVLALVTPAAVASVAVLSHEGIYGLVANAENLTAVGTISYLAVKGLRHYRQIETPTRPRKTGDTGQRQTPG